MGRRGTSLDGQWGLKPQAEKEELFVVDLDHRKVLRERQNFDPSGHYFRPDVLRLTLNRERQQGLNLGD